MKKLIFIMFLLIGTFAFAQRPVLDSHIMRPSNAPTSPIRGETYFDTTTDVLWSYNGATWDRYALFSEISDTNLDIATSGEVDTGTDNTKAISPLALAGSQLQTDVSANNSKISYTDATAVGLNTAKVGITAGQASEITANTLKTGITAQQASDITDNNAKVTNTDAQDLTLTVNTLAISGDPNTDVDLSGYLDNTDTQLSDAQVAAAAINEGFVTGAHTVPDGTGTDDQTATEVPFTPYSTIAATDVQAAIQEVLDESTGGTDDQLASEVPTVTTAFDNNLSAADSDVQTALETLDELVSSGNVAKTADYTSLAAISSPTTGDLVYVQADGIEGLFQYQSGDVTLPNEILSNHAFTESGEYWTVAGEDGSHIVTFNGSTMRFQSDTTTPQLSCNQNNILEIGKTYEITAICSSHTSGSIKTDAFGTSDILASGTGTVTITGVASSTVLSVTRNSTNVDLTMDEISVKEVVVDNEGTIKDGWVRQYDNAINLKWFSAVGDGITDDYQAIMDAHDALPHTGGKIFVPSGRYLHNTAITFTKKVTLIGEGVGNNVAESSSVLLKGKGITTDGVSLTGFGSIVEKVAFVGEEGNTGDGLVIKTGRVALRGIGSFNMGADGVRIGTDAGGENCNLWYIENIKSKANGGTGLTLSEGSGGAGDTNGGTLINADLASNGSHGLEIGNAQLNTLTGVVVQSNGGDGVHFSAEAHYNTLVGGDYETSTGDEIKVTTGAIEVKILGGVLNGTIVDDGTRTVINGLSGDSRNASSTFNNTTVNGNITVSGTVDGRDIATDGATLDGLSGGGLSGSANEVITGNWDFQGTNKVTGYWNFWGEATNNLSGLGFASNAGVYQGGIGWTDEAGVTGPGLSLNASNNNRLLLRTDNTLSHEVGGVKQFGVGATGTISFRPNITPVGTAEGLLYANSTSNRLKYHDGSSYKNILLAGDAATLGANTFTATQTIEGSIYLAGATSGSNILRPPAVGASTTFDFNNNGLAITGSRTTQFNKSLDLILSDLNNLDWMQITMGKAKTSKNAAEFSYIHTADGSNANYFSLGLYNNQVLELYADQSMHFLGEEIYYEKIVDADNRKGMKYFGGDDGLDAISVLWSANGTSAGKPAIIGMDDMNSGTEGVRLQFGDEYNVIENQYDAGTVIRSYHTLVLDGGAFDTTTAVDYTESKYDSATDEGLRILLQDNKSIIFRDRDTGVRTAPWLELHDETGSVITGSVGIDKDGNLTGDRTLLTGGMIVETVSGSITLDGFRGADDTTADTATFTVDGAVAGGTYQVIINRAAAPTIVGSTVMPGTQAFIAATKMSLTFVVNADNSVSHKYAQL